MNEKVVVKNLTKSFDDFKVINDVSFNVQEKEFVCIVGPSGCGKTVLLEVLSGLLSPTSGQVLIDGKAINPKEHNISLVFQEPSCLPWQTVWTNIQYVLELRGIDKSEHADRINKMLKITGLDGFENYYQHQISGGMKQRVAIARAFATEPDVLLMDEPFGHLDAQTRYYMQIEAQRICEELRTTIVFVTNNVEEAVYLGERVIVLSPTPAIIKAEIPVNLARPRNLTSKEFLELRKEIESYYESEEVMPL